MIDLYKILDLEFGASARKIFRRFKRYSKKYHPKSDDSVAGKQKFFDINVAYYILEYDGFREEYDKLYRKRILHENISINEPEVEKQIAKWTSYAKKQAYEYLKYDYKELYRKVPKKQSAFWAIFRAILEII